MGCDGVVWVLGVNRKWRVGEGMVLVGAVEGDPANSGHTADPLMGIRVGSHPTKKHAWEARSRQAHLASPPKTAGGGGGLMAGFATVPPQ